MNNMYSYNFTQICREKAKKQITTNVLALHSNKSGNPPPRIDFLFCDSCKLHLRMVLLANSQFIVSSKQITSELDSKLCKSEDSKTTLALRVVLIIPYISQLSNLSFTRLVLINRMLFVISHRLCNLRKIRNSLSQRWRSALDSEQFKHWEQQRIDT